jgi:hypothetical protein
LYNLSIGTKFAIDVINFASLDCSAGAIGDWRRRPN